MLNEKQKHMVNVIDQVLQDLDDYCTHECPLQACEGCPIRHAKRLLAAQRLVEFIPELGDPLTLEQKIGLKQAEKNPFTVLDGGKK